MDTKNSWVSVLGSQGGSAEVSDKNKAVIRHGTVEGTDATRLSKVKAPEGVSKAAERHRRHILNILRDCLEHVLVSEKTCTVSHSLLNFICRLGMTMEGSSKLG